jgi:outer membrane protein assembly factor BamD (BamD/ComL family)
MYDQTLRNDCDATETERTILLCHEYLQNTTYTRYQKDVFDIQNGCENKLIDKEIYVFNFYLKRGEVAASKNRLTYLKEKYAEKHPELMPRLLYLECKLAKREKNETTIVKNLELLKQKYPKSQYTTMATGLAVKKDYFFF